MSGAVTPSSTPPSRLLGGFATVDHGDAQDFVQRLDVMSALDFFKHYKAETFRLMGVGPGAHVADIGCGTGEDARALCGLVGDTGSVTAFDISDAMIAEAVRRHAADVPSLTFVRAGVDDLGVEDGCFDAVRIDRVLVHVADPEAAMREVSRVVRPGGRIVVSEPDMASVWTATGFPDVGRIILEGVAASVANPLVARSLVDLFRGTNMNGIQLELRNLIVDDPEPGERILNFSAVADALITQGRLSRERAAEWLGELSERKHTGRFLGGMTVFIVAGNTAR